MLVAKAFSKPMMALYEDQIRELCVGILDLDKFKTINDTQGHHSGDVALTSFVGGTRQPELAQLDDTALLNVVRQELGRLVGAKGEPAYVHLQRWPRAIPQYTLGHLDRVRRAEAAQQAFSKDWDTLLANLKAIRSAGYCISHGELDPELVGIAVPVVSREHEVLAEATRTPAG